MAYTPTYNPDGTIYDPNKVENTTNAERMAFADWSTNAVRDIELRLQQEGANLQPGQYITPTQDELKILMALQPNAYTSDFVYGNVGGLSPTPTNTTLSRINEYLAQNPQQQLAYQQQLAQATTSGTQAQYLSPEAQTQGQVNPMYSDPSLGNTASDQSQQQAPSSQNPAGSSATQAQGQPQDGSTGELDPSEAISIYRDLANNFFAVDQNGQQRKLELPEFQQLGINETFVKPGQTVSLGQAVTGQSGAGNPSTLSNMSQTGGAAGQAQSQGASTPTDFIGIYKNIIKDLGLTDIKSKFEAVNKQFQDLQLELNDKISDINENPWLTEGVRVSNIRKLQERYEGKLGVLTNQMEIYDSLYKEGLSQAEFLATGQYNQMVDAQALALKQQEAMANLLQIDPSTFKEVNGGLFDLNTGQWVVPPKPSGGGAGGLTPSQINSTINSIANSFDNEPIVKSYNTVQEGYQTLQSIGVNSTSPADDIAFIYAFAKIMDPNSVVREGEYNTIQKYAQTWADNFGFTAKRIFSNTNFLSADAKQKMLNTLAPKVQTIESQYQNVYDEYQRRISTAQSGGFNTLTDYSGAFSQQQSNPEQDIIDTIQANKDSYGTREELLKTLVPLFPEFDLDEIGYYVYTQIPD